MNIIEMALKAGWDDGADHINIEAFAALVAAHERELIKKAVEELSPVENNPLLQNKPASFWIQNFKQIVFERGTI